MEPVTEEEARAIIARWGELHDLQAGLSAFIPFIAPDDATDYDPHLDASLGRRKA